MEQKKITMNLFSCDTISTQLFELLHYPIICEYDTQEELYFVQIFGVPFEQFDKVENIVFEYSNSHVNEFGTFCIPILYTPEQSKMLENDQHYE